MATQLVEAGVDFSFGCVVRLLAGMDNIVQADGRCNRSGEFGRLCPVYIVNLREENLSRLEEISASQIAAEELLSSFAQDSAAFDGDLHSDQAIRYYYQRLYKNMRRNGQDYFAEKYGVTLYEMLSANACFRMPW